MTDHCTVTAPVRVCDAGGWTDTWFAGTGVVCSLAVEPGVTVHASRRAGPDRVTMTLPDLAERESFDRRHLPGRHPLLEAACARHGPPGALHVEIAGDAPIGSGLGGSAAVTVALVAALWALAGRAGDPDELARAAFEVEAVELGWQSGVQDQLAAAHGGALRIDVDDFPAARVQRLTVPAPAWEALGRRLVTVYLGRPHRSSAVHQRVIAHLESDPAASRRLEPLRQAARAAATALEAGDLTAYGDALRANTEAQAALHPSLVSDAARRVIAVGARHGAVGWKVNGAGGDGGTVSLVTGDDPAPVRAALAAGAGVRVLDLVPAARGCVVTPPPVA